MEKASSSVTLASGFSALAVAQPEGMCPGCPGMGGGGMWLGMILGGLLIVAVIAALVAVTIFLIKRSGPSGGRPISS